MATDPKNVTGQDRRANQEAIIAAVSASRQRASKELLRGKSITKRPGADSRRVYSVRDIVADPHFAAREDRCPGCPTSRPRPRGLDRRRSAMKMTRTPGRVRCIARRCSASTTDEYPARIHRLRREGDIDRLRAAKIVAYKERHHDWPSPPRHARPALDPGSSEKMMQEGVRVEGRPCLPRSRGRRGAEPQARGAQEDRAPRSRR